uniref:Uncharacterized protein n=1 Tax=Roseihalotalea indica TaxID=2867963 RepID=A0AA49GJU6_9BACT|nr:hypothetical protein K4G66_27775 [Tunicatimonas sp. TK19036]
MKKLLIIMLISWLVAAVSSQAQTPDMPDQLISQVDIMHPITNRVV